MTDQSYSTNQQYGDAASDYGMMQFMINSLISRKATATVGIVRAVTNTGGVSPVGFVDLQPMVAQVDGNGQPTPHGIINNVPYFRLQGGANAVIIDPAVGDIGIVIFASRDISSVKNNKAPSNPGSRRQFSMSDGLYLGGILNGTPTNYIRFDSDGNITLKPASVVNVMGDLHATGTITGDVDVIADGKSGKSHVHAGVTTGGGSTDPPT